MNRGYTKFRHAARGFQNFSAFNTKMNFNPQVEMPKYTYKTILRLSLINNTKAYLDFSNNPFLLIASQNSVGLESSEDIILDEEETASTSLPRVHQI
mmetsp:Transcript_15664/g.17415  ORF Transcript_15664/g.17415 Transcript_15664/m.17415 type:complete len:97 (-) Transcript_15664:36-326(-)